MDHQPVILFMNERARAEPGDELFTVRSLEHPVERVVTAPLPHAERAADEMEIVVAENDHRSIAETRDVAQHLERLGAAIDQIAHKPEPILLRVEADFL